RRADELYPILQYRGEIKTAGMLLEDPYYLDAMVRLDRCRTLMSQLESALGSGYAGIRAQAYLELLEEKEILLTSFTDSFLALCVQHGITGSDVLGRVCAAGYFLESGTLPRAAGGFSGQGAVAENGSPARRTPLRKGDPVDPVLHVPGCAEAPMALRSDGIMALMDRGNIRIYDWNRRQYSTARVPIRHKRSDFLYWKGDTLVLRRTKSRICFRFIKKGEGAEEELLPGQEESCPNLLDLFDDREERCRRAGDVAEEEAAGRRKDRRLFYHSRDGVRKLRMLEYPLETEIAYYLRLGQAAVVIDREKIDFVDLDAGTVRETMRVDNATGVYFSDDAGCVLICTRAENIILHRITDRNSHAMPVWEESPKERKKALRMHRLRDFFAPYVMFGPGRKRDLPWRPAGDAVYGSPSPALTCMSVDEGWFACYYYYRNIAVVRLFDLDSGTEILSSEVEPVYWNDMENPPMWAEDRGRKLVLRSLGICHVLDLTTEQPTWSTRREKTASTSTKKPDTAGKGKIEAAGTEKPDIASMKKSTAAKTEKPDTADMKDVLISDCRQHMWRWIPQGHVYETLEDLTNNSFDTAAGRFGARLWRLVFSPVTYVLMPEKVNNPKKVYLLQTIRTEKYLWLVDFLYRTIHIADADGHWLCHTQMKEAFAAADASENTLYLMSENRENIREIRYFSLSDPD
ncbi:MAG: hypothetical protein Q4D81_14755, partial [Eubacteriales bacterium]|nr:hypothetical protein [Eubacteriales bacterium]